MPTVDFRAVYANVLQHVAEGRRRPRCSARSYAGLSLFDVGARPRRSPGREPGYWLAGPNGGVRGFGRGIKFGAPAHAGHPIVGGRGDADAHGPVARRLRRAAVLLRRREVARLHVNKHLGKPDRRDGRDAVGQGLLAGERGGRRVRLRRREAARIACTASSRNPVVGMAATQSGRGYWLVNAAGGVLCFGDAKPHGSVDRRAAREAGRRHVRDAVGQRLLAGDRGRRRPRLRRRAALRQQEDAGAPVVTIARTPSGNGYWLASQDGTVGAFGDAPALGSVKAPTAVLVRC